MSGTVRKWVLLLLYIAIALWAGNTIPCPNDDARPLIILLSSTVIFYINVCFFLRLPIHLMFLPEAAVVTNLSLRRRLVIISWLMTLALIGWGLANGFGCSV